MLTKTTVRNFKQFDSVEIELGNPVVFVGPNNSGKTTALQALSLWGIEVRRWNEKRRGKSAPEKRPGVTINRRDLVSVPIPDANLIWRDLHVREVTRANGKQQMKNIRIDVIVDGVTDDRPWSCGMEFDYANEESLYCRPLRLPDDESQERMPVPTQASKVRIAFLPPMSGLAANETRLDEGAINVRLGEGRTAEVLRNLCYRVFNSSPDDQWPRIKRRIAALFGVELDEPQYLSERGEITMAYRSSSGVRLDLSCSGRGLQQTLLLLAHIAVNRGSVLLLDEPDAHLEILRQRQIYEVLTQSAREHACQVIAASHSEIILNEAADRDVVVAFVGKPHRIDDRGHQLVKSLKEIGFEQYYQAEQTGWVLYLEGATDLAILRAFADALEHPVRAFLEQPFVKYVQNQMQRARDHFRGLREAKPDLVGFALCDRIEHPIQPTPELREYMWERREIENYLCQPETLFAYAAALEETPGPSFAGPEVQRRMDAMRESIHEYVIPAAMKDRSHRWWNDVKASDELLDPVFDAYLRRLGLPKGFFRKSDYQVLARFVPSGSIAQEITHVLDSIQAVGQSSKPIGA